MADGEIDRDEHLGVERFFLIFRLGEEERKRRERGEEEFEGERKRREEKEEGRERGITGEEEEGERKGGQKDAVKREGGGARARWGS